MTKSNFLLQYYIEEEDIEEEEEELDEQDHVNSEVAGPSDQMVTNALQLADATELSESTALLASSAGFIEESDIISHDGDDEEGMQMMKLKITNPNGTDGITWVNFVSE